MEKNIWIPAGAESFKFKLEPAKFQNCLEAWKNRKTIATKGTFTGLSKTKGGVGLFSYQDRFFYIRWDHKKKTYQCTGRKFYKTYYNNYREI